jgi:hypothetical protein
MNLILIFLAHLQLLLLIYQSKITQFHLERSFFFFLNFFIDHFRHTSPHKLPDLNSTLNSTVVLETVEVSEKNSFKIQVEKVLDIFSGKSNISELNSKLKENNQINHEWVILPFRLVRSLINNLGLISFFFLYFYYNYNY